MAFLTETVTPNVTARFWSKVNRHGPKRRHMQTRCWVWTASCDTSGYGQFWFLDRLIRASRFSWILATGSPPSDQVLHECDTPACVRFDHLFEGSHQDNMQDMNKKGRNAMLRLGTSDVEKIRTLYSEGKANQYEIANLFDISQGYVSQVVNRVRRPR